MATKSLHLIRHAESEHNRVRAAQIVEGNIFDPHLFDCPVSPTGETQLAELSTKVQGLGLKPDLVLVSPLTRAIVTAKAAFGHLSDVVYVLHPLLTERVENGCDVGTPKTLLATKFDFPLDFTLVQDEMWFYAPAEATPENYRDYFQSNRWQEPPENVHVRIAAVKQFIRDHPAQNIALVGHSGFFKRWLGASEVMPNCHIESIQF